MGKHDAYRGPFFSVFYETAKPFDGTPTDAVTAIAGRGAIWYDRHTARALVMDGTSARRFAPDAGAEEAIRDLLRAGAVRREPDGLEPGVDIYVAACRAR